MGLLNRVFDTKEITLFFWSYCVRVMMFVFFIWWFLIQGHVPLFGWSYPALGGDSLDYATLSYNLFHYGTFSSSITPPLIPESFRLPGYSFFLYPFFFLPYPLIAGVLVQMVLGSASVVLLYRIGKRFLNEKIAWIGALLLSVEPTTVFNSTLVMSDTVFVFALLWAIYLLLERPRSRYDGLVIGLGAGLLFGYAVLVRVIAEFLAVCLVMAYLFIYKDKLKPWSWTLTKLGAFVVGMVLIVAPWSLRNYAQFGTPTISATPYINFTEYNLVYFYAYQHHTTPVAVQHLFSDQIPYPTSSLWFRSLVNEPIFKQQMHDGLKGNLLPYILFHLEKTLPFFLNDSLRDINLVTGFFPQTTHLTNFTDLLLHKDFDAILRYITTPQPDLWMLLVGATVWFTISVLGIFAVIWALWMREKQLWFVLCAAGIVLYFAILSSPVIQPRYRMPAAPFMLLLAAQGGFVVTSLIKRRDIR